jgi:Rod binding domain-containing protein
MNASSTLNSVGMSQLPANLPLAGVNGPQASFKAKKNASPEQVREQFTQFVGEAFFGQMIKAMRSTVEKPAYFHGGRGEEVFQGQLDQKLAEHLTESSASRFADPMFERQFPKLAAQLEKPNPASEQLSHLRRL